MFRGARQTCAHTKLPLACVRARVDVGVFAPYEYWNMCGFRVANGIQCGAPIEVNVFDWRADFRRSIYFEKQELKEIANVAETREVQKTHPGYGAFELTF